MILLSEIEEEEQEAQTTTEREVRHEWQQIEDEWSENLYGTGDCGYGGS